MTREIFKDAEYWEQREVGEVGVSTSGFPRAGGTSDAVPSLSCSVHEEGGYGHNVLAPGWEVRQAPSSGEVQWLLGAEAPTRAGPTVAPLPLA